MITLPLLMRLVLFIIVSVLLCSCKQGPADKTAGIAIDTVDKTSLPADIPGDNTLDSFLSKLISQEHIEYADSPVEARQVWIWDEENGGRPKEPYALEINGREYLLKNVLDPTGENNIDIRVYDVDTAMRFSLAGRQYCLVKAYPYMCNGRGCLQSYHFILDERRQRVHVFNTFFDQNDVFITDLKENGSLDFLFQDYLYVTEGDFGDTGEHAISFTPYTLNEKGYFVTIKSREGTDGFVIGTFRNLWNPRSFRVIGSNCHELSLE